MRMCGLLSIAAQLSDADGAAAQLWRKFYALGTPVQKAVLFTNCLHLKWAFFFSEWA